MAGLGAPGYLPFRRAPPVVRQGLTNVQVVELAKKAITGEGIQIIELAGSHRVERFSKRVPQVVGAHLCVKLEIDVEEVDGETAVPQMGPDVGDPNRWRGQLCPDAGGESMVARVYDPPWGAIPELPIEDGQPVVPEGYEGTLQRAMAEVEGESNVRLRFVGYTRNERLERRTAVVYGDDIGLSTARARRTMERIKSELEDLSFKYLEPEAHAELTRELTSRR